MDRTEQLVDQAVLQQPKSQSARQSPVFHDAEYGSGTHEKQLRIIFTRFQFNSRLILIGG